MRREIQCLQNTLHSLVSNHEIQYPQTTGQTLDSQTSPSVPTRSVQGIGKSLSESEGNFPTNLSPGVKLPESHRMAMTRENSPEPAQDLSLGAASVLVTEPMGGLYEVTRLRNIRSNQAKLDSSGPVGEKKMDDFIARGVSGLSVST